MAYGDLYQGRRRAAPAPTPAPQPNSESQVEFFRRIGKLPIDARAGDGFTDAERQRAREIRFAMDTGRWLPGAIVPHGLAVLVWDGAKPESSQRDMHAATGNSIAASFDGAGGGDVVARLARKIDASLATDHAPARRLATDQAQPRPTASYKLAQIMGDYELLDEDSFDQSMQHWGVTEPRDRIGLKAEAMALGMMRPRGTPSTMAQRPRKYHAMPGLDDPKSQHFIHKDSKKATKSTAGNPLTIQACTSEGYAAYDGTGINLL